MMKTSFFLFTAAIVYLGEAFVNIPAFQGQRSQKVMHSATVVQESTYIGLCDEDVTGRREVLDKIVTLRHELHQLKQQLKGMPFSADCGVDRVEAAKEADKDWITHYIESYHW